MSTTVFKASIDCIDAFVPFLADWAQHAQVPEHPPVFTLRMSLICKDCSSKFCL
ncbi:MAG: hypothetical protein LBI61_03115 [Puniceicoccales bacterium]|nr:hypothetical protein [Puniceicoccales bacterium]